MTWAPYPEDPRYEVSDEGDVRRVGTGRVRKPSSNAQVSAEVGVSASQVGRIRRGENWQAAA